MNGIVVVVDDDVNTRVITQTLLDSRGWQVRWARDVGEAMQQLTDVPAEATVLDLSLSTASDLNDLRRLHQAWPLLPVVVITDRTEPDLERFARQSGAAALLHKPTDLNHFMRVLDGTLSRATGRRSDAA